MLKTALVGSGSDQPVLWVQLDSYTLVQSHQFDLNSMGAVDRPKGSALNWYDFKTWILPGLYVLGCGSRCP